MARRMAISLKTLTDVPSQEEELEKRALLRTRRELRGEEYINRGRSGRDPNRTRS